MFLSIVPHVSFLFECPLDSLVMVSKSHLARIKALSGLCWKFFAIGPFSVERNLNHLSVPHEVHLGNMRKDRLNTLQRIAISDEKATLS